MKRKDVEVILIILKAENYITMTKDLKDCMERLEQVLDLR